MFGTKTLTKLLTPAIQRFFVVCYEHYVECSGDSVDFETYQKEIYERLKEK